jgi:hypothetical protein
MKLTFSSHISSKTHKDFSLKLFPDIEVDDFLIRTDEEESAEMTAWTAEYGFPDNSVVVARTEFGPALVDPDAPGRVTIEVHIGPGADSSTLADAEAEARKLSIEAGNITADDSPDNMQGIEIIHH